MNVPEFKREDRYLVIKKDDYRHVLTNLQQQNFHEFLALIEAGRQRKGKKPHNYAVVSDSWPMYEDVWAMIQAYVETGEHNPTPATELEWEDFERIRDSEKVDECFRNFVEDNTGDNATCLVRDIIQQSLSALSASKGKVVISRECAERSSGWAHESAKRWGNLTAEAKEEGNKGSQGYYENLANLAESDRKELQQALQEQE